MTSAPPLRVLFVSKPIVPPWHDGSKNLVRDIANHLPRAQATVLTSPASASPASASPAPASPGTGSPAPAIPGTGSPGAPALSPRVRVDPVYKDAGRFAPSVLANARVLGRLLGGDAHDLWHFVFAPNPASSAAARLAITARRAMGFRGPVVQTVASAPRSFERVRRLLFGDHVVALSEWMRGRLFAAGVSASEVSVIPPCAPPPRAVEPREVAALREKLDLGPGPIVLYPGDYEVSTGARTVARAVPLLLRAVPELRVVFACRPKTAAAREARAEVESALEAAGVQGKTRHVGEVDDMAVLLRAASCIVFPVDDLFGKVDVPLVLIEALAAGIPMVLVRGGPLESITSARFVEPEDAQELARVTASLVQKSSLARAHVDEGRALYHERFRPEVVARRYEELYDQLVQARRPRRSSAPPVG